MCVLYIIPVSEYLFILASIIHAVPVHKYYMFLALCNLMLLCSWVSRLLLAWLYYSNYVSCSHAYYYVNYPHIIFRCVFCMCYYYFVCSDNTCLVYFFLVCCCIRVLRAFYVCLYCGRVPTTWFVNQPSMNVTCFYWIQDNIQFTSDIIDGYVVVGTLRTSTLNTKRNIELSFYTNYHQHQVARGHHVRRQGVSASHSAGRKLASYHTVVALSL